MKTENFLIFFLAIVIILSGFMFTVFNEGFYEEQFIKNKVYDKYGEEIVRENSIELINYLKKGFPLTTSFFNEKEKLHLRDVKKIIDNFILLFYIALIFSIILAINLIFKKEYLKIVRVIRNSSIIILVFLLIIFLLSLNFEKFFLGFHKVFFTNNLFILNPELDNLINLFPESFFYSALKRILIIDFIFSLVLFLAFLFPRLSDVSPHKKPS